MGFGSQTPPDPWQKPLAKPNATSWTDLVACLRKTNPGHTTDSRLRRRHKQKLRDRDGHQCQLPNCSVSVSRSATAAAIGEQLHVHHIVKAEHGGRHHPENLLTLCKPCHRELHAEEGEGIPEWEQFIGDGSGDQDFIW